MNQPSPPRLLVIACGAIARELVALREAIDSGPGAVTPFVLQCLPAELHNRPERIVPALRAKLDAARGVYRQVLIGYGDCGTGGALDRLIADHDDDGFRVERLPGAHCYAFYAGLDRFDRLSDEEPGSLYLTDFLARHFDRLIWQGLGLDRHPQLLDTYFGHYRRLVFLAQRRDDPNADAARAARAAAERLGLDYHYLYTGYGALADRLRERSAA